MNWNDTRDSLSLEQGESADGKRIFIARDCRIPCDSMLTASLSGVAVERDGHADHEHEKAAHEEEAEPEAKAEPKGMEDMRMMLAIASSTGVDHHGTEMTLQALRGMAEQMKNGVVYTPSHRQREWDEVMGRTVDAEIVQGMIVKGGASGDNEDGYHLRATVGLYPDHPMTEKLLRAIERGGHAVGTSIGGWFTDVEFVVNEEDKVERVLIKQVELDHLATTRTPSNRESWIEGLRTRAEEAISAMREPEADAQPEADAPTVEERHIVSVEEGEDTITVVYGKSMKFEGVEPMQPHDGDADDDDDEVEDEKGYEEERAPSAAEEPAERTVSVAETADLDTAQLPGEDGAKPDAEQRAVPPEQITPSPEDGSMSEHTERAAEATVADERMDRLERSLDKLAGVVATLAERGAAAQPNVETPEQRAAALEQQVTALQNKLARTMATAGRAGVGALTRERVAASGGFAGIVQRTAPVLGDTSALRMVCEQQAERRDATINNTPSRGELESDLRSMLAAAFADGIIVDPDASASWEG